MTENPTPGGDSKKRRLASWFHEKGLKYSAKLLEPEYRILGPIYCVNPSRLEHPGPPFSHKTISSVLAVDLVDVTKR